MGDESKTMQERDRVPTNINEGGVGIQISATHRRPSSVSTGIATATGVPG